MKASGPLESPAFVDITTHRLATVKPTTTHSTQTQTLAPFAGWMLLPQRLFLALTFLYAGIQKFTDPQFFHKATPGYIGNQIIGFAHNSPLHYILIKYVLSHAVLFGWAVALGEIAIGLGALVGFLFRPAAFFGLVLSTMFFLTASWTVYPYFYGADIVFMFCWFTMFLTGPVPTGLPSLDGKLQKILFPQGFSAKHGWLTRVLAVLLLGVNTLRATDQTVQNGASVQPQSASRRSFVRGALSGSVTVAGVAVMGLVLRVFNRAGVGGASTTGAVGGTQATGAGSMVAQMKAVPENSALTFTIPTTGDPGVLIHLADNQFVAYDATCTHAGCQVAYDPASRHLVCPCHGATYDPTHQAAVLSGPTSTPLTEVPLHIDQSTGDITIA